MATRTVSIEKPAKELPGWLAYDIEHLAPEGGWIEWATVHFAGGVEEELLGPSPAKSGNNIYVIGRFVEKS